MAQVFFFFAAALFILFSDSNVWAFHEGGTGPCEACHTMHNSISAGTSPNFKPNQYSISGGVTSWTGFGSGVNAVVNPKGSVGNAMTQYLLRGSDPSSTCLNCHEETGNAAATGSYVSTAPADMPVGMPPIELTPGGDFGWIKKNYTWGTIPVYTDSGYLHGHNIVAADFLYTQDPMHNQAQGGTYPSASLTCISCHDPHGMYRRKSDGSITNSPAGGVIIASGSYNTSPAPLTGQAVGDYRLLGGVGYLPPELAATPSYAFSYAPPASVAPSTYNRSEALSQTVVAYGIGMSQWCRNCHPNIHTGTGNDPTNVTNAFNNVESFPQPGNTPYYSHPSGNEISPANDQLGSQIASNYLSYIATGNYGGTNNSYWSLVPYEINTNNYSTLQTVVTNANSGAYPNPQSTDLVSCMSCHRAHASGWDYAMRYKYNGTNDGNYGFTETITDSNGGVAVWPGTDTTPTDPNNAMGRTSTETQQAYYGRPASLFKANETTLCNKCHIGAWNGVYSGSAY